MIITDKSNEITPIEETKKVKVLRYFKNSLILILTVLLIVLWFWKNNQMATLKSGANDLLVQNKTDGLKQLSQAYIWSVRKELMTNNIEQINLYSIDMIKEKGFQSIIICNKKGTVISATNKKQEGKPFSSFGKEEYLQLQETKVESLNDSTLVVASPIMGFNSKLGTLVIEYQNITIK